MEFIQIQDKITKSIIQYYVDGLRVTSNVYRQMQNDCKEISHFLTTRTRSGNFRHLTVMNTD